FFLHGSWMHLIGNAYYFFVFGDDVEDDMTLSEFVKFLFWGHVSGLVLHSVMTGFSSVPLIGASAGISALLGYYMVRFPARQISFMIFFFVVWAHLPAFGVFLWKFGWEYLVASTGPATNVAHWAHLGGAIYGFFAATQKGKASMTQ
ncbi:MAG: rhomboid family intramembrane serine protease, partial [Pseudomonadota bacterium]